MSKKSNNKFWNGEICKIRVLNVRLTQTEAPEGTIPWSVPHAGTVRQAIEVAASWGQPFLIDNEDGRGYQKLVLGGGMNWPHASFGTVEILGEVPESEWKTEWNEAVTKETRRVSDEYWAIERPEILEHIRKMKEAFSESKRNK